ncbi:hypothetical protein [Streptomyces sp. NPDC097619]|uniref:hypothetical protein n=1 Tax=Streptomyces sp. NPDC097619 TaxID=3157228 RepID=UPI0033245FF8
MKKIVMPAALAAAALGLAAPAHADSGFGGGAAAAGNHWQFAAAGVCVQELAVVPMGASWTGDSVRHCLTGTGPGRP